MNYEFDGRDADHVSFRGYLRSYESIRCSDAVYTDSEHDSITSIALGLIFVWPVGMVAMYTAALLPCHGPLHQHIQTPLTRATGLIHKDCNAGDT